MSTTRWLSESEQQAWRAFLHAAKLVLAEMDRGVQQHGLSGTDYGVLVSLSEAADHRLRMTELASTMLLEKSRLSHQITRMERDGLVRRESCPGDRRGQYAVLTDLGWQTIKRVAPHHVELVRAVFVDRLSPTELETITQLFEPLAKQVAQRCPAESADGD